MTRFHKTFVSVPKLWPGETVVLLASGPSMTLADATFVRGKARVIAINTTYQLAPWADVLWATDARWWGWYKGVPEFTGRKFGIYTGGLTFPRDVHVLRHDGYSGLCLDPTGVRSGKNGGYAALNLAVHLGAARIVLVGYDMAPQGFRHHWHADHPYQMTQAYQAWRRLFATLVAPLSELGIPVINASRETALECFPRQPLETVFAERSEAVA